MAKVSIKNLDFILKNIDKVFKTTLSDGSMFKEIAKFAQNRIVDQTRAGRDLDPDNKSGKQPPLSEGYIKYRERVKKGQEPVKPSPAFFRPKFSNLTLTGQLLNSVKNFINIPESEITIRPTGIRDDGLTNVKLTSDLRDRGRTFLGLDEKGKKVIRRKVLDVLRRNIRNFNK